MKNCYHLKHVLFVRDTNLNILSRLEIKQLRILKALLREKNVSRVASQVGLTQQAVSDQLRKLREIFDDQLFIRRSNGLIPTSFAEEIEEKIEKILFDIEELVEQPKFEPENINSTFVISATDYAQQIVLPLLLQKIRLLAPNLKIVIRDFDAENLHELMITGKINLALTFPSYIPNSYSHITLFSERFVCVTSKKTKINKKHLELKDIASMPQIIVSPSKNNLRGSIDSYFEKEGIKRNIVISAPCFSVVPRYLETTDAIAFLPSKVLPNENVTQLHVVDEMPSFEIIAAWHPKNNKDLLHKWILNLLKDGCPPCKTSCI